MNRLLEDHDDTHDSANPLLFCQWKADYPDYLVGTKGAKYPYGANRWGGREENRDSYSAGPSDRLLRLTKTGVSGAAGAELRPPFGAVLEVPIDEGLSLTCRFASYIDDVL